jgi:hypothetical protein
VPWQPSTTVSVDLSFSAFNAPWAVDHRAVNRPSPDSWHPKLWPAATWVAVPDHVDNPWHAGLASVSSGGVLALDLRSIGVASASLEVGLEVVVQSEGLLCSWSRELYSSVTGPLMAACTRGCQDCGWASSSAK